MSTVTREEFDQLTKKVDALAGSSKKPKTPRAPSEYNIFIKDEIRRLKEGNPNMDHKMVFTQAVQNWKKQQAGKQ